MHIGLLKVEINLPHSHSLKNKRQILRPLLQNLRRDFNITIAETAYQDTWQRSEIGIATVSVSKKHCQELLDLVIQQILELQGEFLVTHHEIEFL